MVLFSETAENSGRQAEVDLARGFAAMLIVIVHVGLYLGSDIDHGLWTFCDIAGSEPCAPVLMALMGIGMVYSRHQRPDELLKRGICLFIMGYALNFFRSILPLLILGNVDEWASVQAFFVVDILPFAGLSFMLMALLKKLRLSNAVILAISIVMVVTNQFIMLPGTVPWNSELLTGLVNLFCPVTEWSCFPLLTWFAFPAFGLVYGEMLMHCRDKNRLYAVLLPAGLCGSFFVGYGFYRLYPDYANYYLGNNFYYMGLKNVLLAMLIICFVLSFWFFAEKILPAFIKRWLGFLSRNLTVYYIISWILISILLHAQSVLSWKFGNTLTIGIMVLLVSGSAGITKLCLSVKSTVQKRKGSRLCRKAGAQCGSAAADDDGFTK